MEIILLVEMLKTGNEQLKCFRGRPDDAIAQLRERFRLDLNDRACREYVYALIDSSVENWRTDWYDRYQRCKSDAMFDDPRFCMLRKQAPHSLSSFYVGTDFVGVL